MITGRSSNGRLGDRDRDPGPAEDPALEEPRPGRPSRSWRWGIAGLLAFGGLLVLPVRIPSTVSSYAEIQCAREWSLVRGPDGLLSASVFNHDTGVSSGYQASSFDRSSSVYFTLNPAMIPGRGVTQGDTVGVVSSSETQERLIALNGELASAERLLAVNATGEKAVVVYAAEQRLAIAQRKRKEQERAFYAKGLLPASAYESAENSLRAAGDEVALAAAALEEARTGAKPEQIQLIHGRVSALKDELAALRRRAATHTLIAPISGRVARSASSDVLLTISDTTRYVATIPVRLSDVAKVLATPAARVTLRGLSVPLHGTIAAMDREVSTIGTERVVMATAILEHAHHQPVLGLAIRCDIACRPVSLAAILKHFLISLVSA